MRNIDGMRKCGDSLLRVLQQFETVHDVGCYTGSDSTFQVPLIQRTRPYTKPNKLNNFVVMDVTSMWLKFQLIRNFCPLSGRTMALGLTQPLKEMNTRNISWWVKAAGA